MRAKMNCDMYGGGALISEKEPKDYSNWAAQVFAKAQELIDGKKPQLKL